MRGLARSRGSGKNIPLAADGYRRAVKDESVTRGQLLRDRAIETDPLAVAVGERVLTVLISLRGDLVLADRDRDVALAPANEEILAKPFSVRISAYHPYVKISYSHCEISVIGHIFSSILIQAELRQAPSCHLSSPRDLLVSRDR